MVCGMCVRHTLRFQGFSAHSCTSGSTTQGSHNFCCALSSMLTSLLTAFPSLPPSLPPLPFAQRFCEPPHCHLQRLPLPHALLLAVGRVPRVQRLPLRPAACQPGIPAGKPRRGALALLRDVQRAHAAVLAAGRWVLSSCTALHEPAWCLVLLCSCRLVGSVLLHWSTPGCAGTEPEWNPVQCCACC